MPAHQRAIAGGKIHADDPDLSCLSTCSDGFQARLAMSENDLVSSHVSTNRRTCRKPVLPRELESFMPSAQRGNVLGSALGLQNNSGETAGESIYALTRGVQSSPPALASTPPSSDRPRLLRVSACSLFLSLASEHRGAGSGLARYEHLDVRCRRTSRHHRCFIAELFDAKYQYWACPLDTN